MVRIWSRGPAKYYFADLVRNLVIKFSITMKYIRFWQGCRTTMARATVVSCPIGYFTTQTPKKYCKASWGKCEPESKQRSRRRQAPCSPSCWAAASHHLHSPRSLCLGLCCCRCLCCCLLFSCCLILCQLLFHFLFLVSIRFSPPLCSSASADWRLWTLLAVRRPAFTCKQKRSEIWKAGGEEMGLCPSRWWTTI